MKRWLVFLFFFSTLSAEIQEVQITWNKTSCDGNCINLLRQSLNRYGAIAAYKLDPNKGIAYLRWMPEANFDLLAIKRIYQSIGFGFGIGNVMVKVRGVVERKGNDYILRSLGDGTRFRLLGPQATQAGFRSSGSWQSYPLTGDQKKQLQDALMNHLVAEVSGGIYFTQWDMPMIIIQNLQFPNKLSGENQK